MNTHALKKSNTHGHEFSDTHYGRFSWFFLLPFLTFEASKRAKLRAFLKNVTHKSLLHYQNDNCTPFLIG